MAELTIDSDIIQRAAASAIVTLLGDDKDKLVAGLVKDALATPSGYGNKDTEFDKILKSVIHDHTRAVIRAWLAEHEDEVRAHINGLIDERKDDVLATVSEDIFKRMGWHI